MLVNLKKLMPKQDSSKALEKLRRMELLPDIATRSVVVGTTGSGKTMLMQKIAILGHSRQPVVVFDPKCRWEVPECGEIWHGPSESPPNSSYVVYRPRFGADIPAESNEIAKMIYDQGDTLVIFDEVYPLLGKDTINGPRAIKFLYCLGRGLGITVVAGIQRPSGSPVYFMSECEQAYIFNLRNPNDRGRVADYFGEELRSGVLSLEESELIISTMGDDPENRKYWFRYATDAEGVHPRPLRLDLGAS